MKSEVLAQETPIVLDKRKMKQQVVNPVEYFPEFKQYELYVGKVNPNNEWWIQKVMRNSKTKYVLNHSISVIKCIGGYAFSAVKFVTKQSFRGLGYICNKIGDALGDKGNYNSNNRNVACVKHDNTIPYQHQQLRNVNVGNGFSEQEYVMTFNKPIHPNCSNSYDDIPSFDDLLREYSNK